MSNDTRKRSRLNAELAPIHVGELLGGAGMTGFLSVLRIPEHFSHSSTAQGTKEERRRGLADDGAQKLLSWLSAKTMALLDQAGCQQDSLLALEAAAGRMNQAVQRIYRRTKGFKVGCVQFRSPVPSGKELFLDEQG